MTITQDCKAVWSEWSVGGSRLSVHGKDPAAHGRTGKQMGYREKHISVWSDIRRSLHPIRAAQEVQTDWDWWHQTVALQLWINEEKKTGQQNNKTTVSSPFLTHREKNALSVLVSMCSIVCDRLCVRCCTSLCACVVLRRDASKPAEGGKVKGRELLTNGFYFLRVVGFMLQTYSAVQCRHKQMAEKRGINECY